LKNRQSDVCWPSGFQRQKFSGKGISGVGDKAVEMRQGDTMFFSASRFTGFTIRFQSGRNAVCLYKAFIEIGRVSNRRVNNVHVVKRLNESDETCALIMSLWYERPRCFCDCSNCREQRSKSRPVLSCFLNDSRSAGAFVQQKHSL